MNPILRSLPVSILLLLAPPVHAAVTQIYFTEANGVFRVNPDGSSKLLIGDTAGFKFGIDVDDVKKKVYWTNITLGKLKSASLTGSGITDLVASGLDGNNLVVDGSGGDIYITRGPATRTVEKRDLDGTDPVTLAGPLAAESFSTPAGIDVDTDSGVVYWVDSTIDSLYSVSTGGGPVTTVFDFGTHYGSANIDPLGLALDVDGSNAYVTLDGADKVVKVSLGGSPTLTELITTGIGRPRAAAVKHCVASESIYAASFSDVVCWTSSSRSGLRATE